MTRNRGKSATIVLVAAVLGTWTAVRAAGAAESIELEIPAVSGLPGDTVEMSVVLHTNGNEVAGVQIDIHASAGLIIGANQARRPDCWRNEGINKDFTVYSFPVRELDNLSVMRSLVLSLTNVDPIPDGSLLFTCRITIDPSAEPGTYRLETFRLGGATPDGEEIAAVGSGGDVFVADPVEGSAPLNPEGGMQAGASGGCAIDATNEMIPSAVLLALPLIIWGLRRRAIHEHVR